MNKKTPSTLLLTDIKQLITAAKQRAAIAINSELTILYWQIGKRIQGEILRGKRAEYGKQIIANLSQQLMSDYGEGWGDRQLWYCVRMAEAITNEGILNTLCSQLSWSHFRIILPISDSLKREFYIELCRVGKWSVRQLQERINSQLFERTAISKKPEKTIQKELAILRKTKNPSPQIFLKDPYFLNFLDLKDRYLEKDLEDAILREIEKFLLEMGAGFTFVARQKHLQIDDRDFYIDLLLYSRKLKRLIAIDLKIGEFEAGFKGQMELYLRWLAKNEKEVGEKSPLGIILCTGKAQEQIELLELYKSGIHVAKYLTALPPRKLLEDKLQSAIKIAQQRISNKEK
jgi:predicted nuclease of restriction endonuclease-like (RecB) superfamily